MAKRSKKALSFPGFDSPRRANETRFSSIGYVLRHAGRRDVFLAGSLIASVEDGDTAKRNMVLVILATDPRTCFEDLARAFDISSETIRLLRRLEEDEGTDAVLARSHGGSESKVTPAMYKRVTALFDKGLTIDAVHDRVGKSLDLSRATVGNLRQRWARERDDAAKAPAAEPVQLALPFEAPAEPVAGSVSAPRDESEHRLVAPVGSAEEHTKEALAEIGDAAPVSRNSVQHAGGWLMVAMVASLGVYARAEEHRQSTQKRGTLRMALDAVLIALASGGKCVEGVRRLAASGAAALLLAASAPSATWVRRILGAFSANNTGMLFHSAVAGDLVRSASRATEAGRPSVFYVDNHHRPYWGKQTLRLAFRMQDKRALPGASDYYVSDDDGIPLWRHTVSDHGSLAAALAPIAFTLRTALGSAASVLVAFDRAGSFPSPMSELKTAGVDFVAWERAPFRAPSRRQLRDEGEKVVVGKETYYVLESRTNLGKGRGRLRRLSILTPENGVVNVIAHSKQETAWLLRVMLGRWSQENGLRHGVERWGINQLDGRQVEHYDPDTIIPNPARRRLDRDLEIVRAREGESRRKLARERSGAAKKQLKDDIAELVATEQRLEALRPSAPEHVALKDSELADTLVFHTKEYKDTIDTLRIACANAEAELAAVLAPSLKRPEEAKRALQNVFAAPGSIRVGENSITITLDPPGTKNEREAFAALFAEVNDRRLAHPGDPQRRQLRFKLQGA